jgi:8-oxo-dGTP pyrophosphatase MutT (NUDIX family)
MKEKVIKAGGGLVVNNNHEYLLMFRRGKWDLPKGKWDDGETIEECALREVKEETGLKNVTIEKFIDITHHNYTFNDILVHKETYWYLMKSPLNEPLIPQTEEDIEQVCWVPKNELLKYLNNTYPNIIEIFEKSGLL